MREITIRETELTEEVLEKLIEMSVDWEQENSCTGYRRNERSDIEGKRIFLAEINGRTVGYLFGCVERLKGQPRSCLTVRHALKLMNCTSDLNYAVRE